MFYAWLFNLIKTCDYEVSSYTLGMRYLAMDKCNTNPNSMHIIYWYNPQPRSRLN